MLPRFVLTELAAFRGCEAAVLFSGGKDSLFALRQAIQHGLCVRRLVYAITTAPLPHNDHVDNLPLVAEAVGLPLTVMKFERGREQASLIEGLRQLRMPVIVAGNIFLQDIHDWYATACEQLGISIVDPLWKRSTDQLLREEIAWGLEALIIGVDTPRMPLEWLGRVLSRKTLEAFLADSARMGFDPCGEEGEFHTLAMRSPLHRFPLRLINTHVQIRDLSPYAGRLHALRGQLVRAETPAPSRPAAPG